MPMEENDADELDMICKECVSRNAFLVHYDGETIDSTKNFN